VSARRRDVGDLPRRVRLGPVLGEEREGPAQAAEHAEAEHVDLHEA
jgi:hypothetical protein